MERKAQRWWKHPARWWLLVIGIAAAVGWKAAESENAHSEPGQRAERAPAVHTAADGPASAAQGGGLPTPSEAVDEGKAAVKFDARPTEGVHDGEPLQANPIKREVRPDPEMERAIREKQTPQRGLFETVMETETAADEVRIRLVLTNISGDVLPVRHGSGQQYDVWVVNENGEEVYRWSADKSFTMALVRFALEPSEQLEFEERWDLRDNDGHPVPAGTYTIQAAVLLQTESGAIDPSELVAQAEVEIGS